MMSDRIFGDREKAMEEAYFRDQDARLLDTLRRKADLDEVAVALGEKLQVDNPELLIKVRNLGITMETAPAFFLLPLVQVAWAEGRVSRQEHDAVLRLARERSIETGSPAYLQLEKWLHDRPDDVLFETAVEVIKYGFSVLPEDEKEARIKEIVDGCRQVAQASGSTLGFVLGLKNVMGLQSVSGSEAATLDAIATTLRRPGLRS
jgi:hypothetical protein